MLKALPSLAACLLLLAVLYSLVACQPAKKTAYFQTITSDTTLQHTVTKNFDLRIQPGDLLHISIASASPELSGLFNTAPDGEGGSGGYQVDKEGTIELYKLGRVKVAGLSRAAIREKLLHDLAPYLKDPVVTVRLANQRITVLGAVGSPGVIPVTADQVSVLEAIGQSGDLAENGRRDNVLVIRQTDAGKEFHHLNLLDHSVFTSPYFYLQNEDVVYVEAEPKIETAKTQQVISFILSGLSIVTLILTLSRYY